MIKNKTWKILAIVFISFFILENLFLTFAIYSVSKEESLQRHCFYDVCALYPDADYFDKVCTCYDYGYMDELVVAKTEVME